MESSKAPYAPTKPPRSSVSYNTYIMLTMEEAMKQSAMRFAAGEIVKGTIIEVRPKEVLVDIGYKSEGVISGNEFDDIKTVKVGDEIDVLIEKLEDKEGMVVLSKEKAEFKKNWDKILTICNEGGTINGKVKAVVKGGLLVNIGVEAFLPASQIDIIPPKNLAQFVGNTYDFKVVKINQERQNIVLSRRELIEQERNERRSKLLDRNDPGRHPQGHGQEHHRFRRVHRPQRHRRLAPHHRYELGPHRSSFRNPQSRPGHRRRRARHQQEKERVSLGLKQKLANPWDSIEAEVSRSAPRSKARSSTSCPTARSWNSNPVSKASFTSPNFPGPSASPNLPTCSRPDQEIEAVVLGINREEQKISLGIRQLETNPWDKALEKYPPGTKVKGKIRNLTSYGAFIELEEGLDGMIHVSDISWTRKINHPSEVLKKGDEVEAVVLEVDKANQRISVGVKQLSEDPWNNIDKFYKVGDLVTGKVTKLASFGAFIGLQHDIDGLVHISQVSEERVDKIKNVLKVGQEVTARVIKIDKGDRRIGLSIKAAELLARTAQGRTGRARFAQAGRRPGRAATRLRRRRPGKVQTINKS